MHRFLEWLVKNPALVTLFSKEIMMTFIVTSIEILPGKKSEYSPARSLVHGLFWFWTIRTWFVREKGVKRLRLLRFVWAFLITGWFFALLHYWIDRAHWHHADLIYLIAVGVTMSFLTYCMESRPVKEKTEADGSVSEARSTGRKLWFRTLLWFTAAPRWFRTGDDDIVIKYIRYMWGLLITGWILALLHNWIVIWAVMSFLTYCIEAMPNKALSTGRKLWIRTVFWPSAIPRWYLMEKDRVTIEYTTVFMWVPLILCWLLGVNSDETRHMLSILGRTLGL